MGERRARYEPREDLAGRSHVTLVADPIARGSGGGAFYGLAGDEAYIVVDPDLAPAEQDDAIAHELVHDERRILYPDAPPLVMQREEHTVRRITAARRVPPDQLLDLVQDTVQIEPVTIATVCDHFGVGPDIAEQALRRLQAELLDPRR